MTIEQAVDYLSKTRDFSGILGQTIEIRESIAQAFSQKVSGVIGSTETNDQAVCWRLVQVVKVRSRAPILQNGLVLVDLPGHGDYNTARARMAEKYVRMLDRIWVVGEIKRAVDESVARELLGSSFQRQLLMENKYDEKFLSFIATHTDNINYNEVID
ncbi:hypothetical protein N431DRAFT_463723 [Stipitochalara longipes BDJ]|nr:hypothetical protein N431DRAFT_463723 [Stipitochalara longipes BDJ]